MLFKKNEWVEIDRFSNERLMEFEMCCTKTIQLRHVHVMSTYTERECHGLSSSNTQLSQSV